MVDRYRIESYNLYDILRQELNTFGTNWTAKEKADYIYIRMCIKRIRICVQFQRLILFIIKISFKYVYIATRIIRIFIKRLSGIIIIIRIINHRIILI